jgi:phage shock protein A
MREEDVLDLLAGLASEKAKVERRIKLYEDKLKVSTGEMRKHYENKLKEAQTRLEELDAKIAEIEERKNAELYG